MDGSVKYVNLRTGAGGGGTVIPDGTVAGQVLVWNGSSWSAQGISTPINIVFYGKAGNCTLEAAAVGGNMLNTIIVKNQGESDIRILIQTQEDIPREMFNEVVPAGASVAMTINTPFNETLSMDLSSEDWAGSTVDVAFYQHKQF